MSLYIGNHIQKPIVLLQSGFSVGKDHIELQNVYRIQTTTALSTLTWEKYLIQRMSTNLYVSRWSKLLKNLPLVRAHICSGANSIMHYFLLVEYNILHSE